MFEFLTLKRLVCTFYSFFFKFVAVNFKNLIRSIRIFCQLCVKKKSHLCTDRLLFHFRACFCSKLLQIQIQKSPFFQSNCNWHNFKDQMSIRSTVGSVLNRNRGSNLEAEREAIVQKGSQEKFHSKSNTKIIDKSLSIYY